MNFLRPLLLVSAALCSSVTMAQETTGDAPPPTTTTTTTEPTTPTTTPATTTAPATTTPTTTPAPAPADDDHRPDADFSLGLGVGWFFPSEILAPNTTSVRLKFGRALTLEPFLDFSLDGSDATDKNEAPFQDQSSSNTVNSGYTLALGTTLRVPLWQRGDLDLQVLASVNARYSANTQTQDVEFADDSPDTTSTLDQTSLSLNAAYGVGIEWCFLDNLAVSVDALNPLARWSTLDSERVSEGPAINPDTGEVTTEETTTKTHGGDFLFGAIFQPQVRLMFHLYF